MIVLLSNSSWSIRDALRSQGLLGSLGIVSGAWCILLGGHLLADTLESTLWIALSFAAATALAVTTRPRRFNARSRTALALGFSSGFASYPCWVAAIWITGRALGLDSRPPETASAPGEATLWLSAAVMSPVFEELLYRERLVPLLRERFGTILAVVISSGLFAISHLHPWSVTGCFLIGLALGTIYVATHSATLCISIHAGFNVASLVCGLPPERVSLSPVPSAVVAWGALLVAGALLRQRTAKAQPSRSSAPDEARHR